MEQLNLIDVPSKPVEYVRDGMLHRNHGRWEERNFHGYRQTRYRGEPWMFYISGFTGPALPDGSDSIGHVLMFDGSYTACKMDMKDRVYVDGRWYSHRHWDH